MKGIEISHYDLRIEDVFCHLISLYDDPRDYQLENIPILRKRIDKFIKAGIKQLTAYQNALAALDDSEATDLVRIAYKRPTDQEKAA